MKAIIQRVNYSKLKVNGEIYSEIEKGLMILLGITHDDTVDDIKWLSNKIVNLRIKYHNYFLTLTSISLLFLTFFPSTVARDIWGFLTLFM